MTTRFKFQRLDKRFDRSSFDCGEPRVNRYLQREAGQHDRNRNLNTWLLVDEANRIVGFASVKLVQITIEELRRQESRLMKGFSKRGEMVALLLAWLGVDLEFGGQNIGEVLLNKCIRDARRIDEEVGPCFGVVTDPLTAASKSYFLQRGFVELAGTERLLYVLENG